MIDPMEDIPMKIIQLEYFCAVARYHSISEAARKLYVTQPAISNAIKELEICNSTFFSWKK